MSLAYVRIIRPINCVMMGFAVIVGSVLAEGFDVLARIPWSLFLGYLAGFLLTASSMVLNDYADRDIDAINEPLRAIPSGAISPKIALTYGVLLTAFGIALSGLLGLESTSIAALAWALFLAYTLVGKRTGFLGNILVSLCVAVPFLYGAVIIGKPLGSRIVIFASIALLANLGREVNKGIVDLEGDKTKNVKTVAARYGPRQAATVAALLYFIAVGFSLVPILSEMVTLLYYLPFVVITDLGLAFGAFAILRNPSRENARTQKKRVLFWMLFGLLAFLAGSAAL